MSDPDPRRVAPPGRNRIGIRTAPPAGTWEVPRRPVPNPRISVIRAPPPCVEPVEPPAWPRHWPPEGLRTRAAPPRPRYQYYYRHQVRT